MMFFRKNKKVNRDYSDKDLIRRHYHFFGIVQGVGFRFTAAMAAESLNLTGWIRNEDDGSVTMEIQGKDYEIDEVLKAINNSRYIRIERTDCDNIPIRTDESSFDCYYY